MTASKTNRSVRCLNYLCCIEPLFPDDQQFKKLIMWLESTKIKRCKPDLLKQLSNVNSNNWHATFEKYKQELGCPSNISGREAEIDWIAGYALKKEYANKSKQCLNKI